jgi:uncharacterized protein (TIGR02453 family)
MAAGPYFTAQTFRFLKDLAQNNDRAWFAANKARYEAHVKDPALRFIQDFASPLARISPHFHAGPRSLFRIYRDTRFSKDKSPYKTHTGIQFRHDQAKDAHAPGFYLHVEPGSVFVALGMWRPESAALRKIREHIVEEPAAWKKAVHTKKFTDGFELEGDRLKRAPKGFDPDHPLVEDLKRKDFIGVRRVTQKAVTSPDLPTELARMYAEGKPLMKFLCEAVAVPF